MFLLITNYTIFFINSIIEPLGANTLGNGVLLQCLYRRYDI